MSTHDYIRPIDPALPDEEQARVLEEDLDTVMEVFDIGPGTEIPLSEADTARLREYAASSGPHVKAAAIDFLAEFCPCDWSDLENWFMDPDEHVRSKAKWSLDHEWSFANRLCLEDKPRCVALLSRAADKYDDYAAGIAMEYLSEDSPEFLELTWAETQRLLDLRRPDLTEMLVCTYFEHVIPENNWGPDDPHIKPWIEGSDPYRKTVLLDVAGYMGLEEGRLQAIVEALARDEDRAIAARAQGLLPQP